MIGREEAQQARVTGLGCVIRALGWLVDCCVVVVVVVVGGGGGVGVRVGVVCDDVVVVVVGVGVWVGVCVVGGVEERTRSSG